MGVPDLRNSPLAAFKSNGPKRILEESGAEEAIGTLRPRTKIRRIVPVLEVQNDAVIAYRFAVTTCPARFVSMIRTSVAWRCSLIGIQDFRSSPLATSKSKAPKRILERSRAKEAMEDSTKERKSVHYTSLG